MYLLLEGSIITTTSPTSIESSASTVSTGLGIPTTTTTTTNLTATLENITSTGKRDAVRYLRLFNEKALSL